MYQTFKLCNMRDCHAHDVEPVPFDAVDPCRVFWHEETGMWYDEVLGTVIPMHEHGDGQMFDIQAWLTGQAQQALTVWKPGMKVHEQYKRHMLPSGATKPAARAPKFSNEVLDGIANDFLRTRREVGEVADEVRDLGNELHGYLRMQRKWGDHPMLATRIAEIREKRDALRGIQSDLDKGSHLARKHLKSDNKWTSRWTPKMGKWEDFVLIWDNPESEMTWVIDRHGLKLDGHYLYLPDNDQQFMEAALYAQQKFDIPTGDWKKIWIPAERLGAPMRRYGKKNANGRRIRARVDQRKYAETVRDIVKQLRQMRVNCRQFGRDDELYQHYLDKIAPRLSRG